MTDALPRYELFAIRYARRDARRSEHFIGGDPHDGPMPMDYFTWVAISQERSIVIDTGFTAEIAAKRGREHLRCPIDALGLLGLSADTVQDVVLTHLHYDHVGNFHRFPVARFHLQEQELAHATGKYMRHAYLSHAYEVEEVCGIVRLTYGGRVIFHHGAAVIAPGIEAQLAGGHTGGIQFVRVHTARGWVVLASDVSHYYENMERGRPTSIAFHVGDILEAFDMLAAAAASRDHVIPGHDPLVMQRYPAPRPELEGVVVRLDVMPGED